MPRLASSCSWANREGAVGVTGTGETASTGATTPALTFNSAAGEAIGDWGWLDGGADSVHPPKGDKAGLGEVLGGSGVGPAGGAGAAPRGRGEKTPPPQPPPPVL